MPWVYCTVGTATLPHSVRRVGAALDEVDARDAGQAHQIVHGEHALALHQAVDHQAVLGGIDVPPALVVALEVQAAGRDDAEQALQRREAHRRLRARG